MCGDSVGAVCGASVGCLACPVWHPLGQTRVVPADSDDAVIRSDGWPEIDPAPVAGTIAESGVSVELSDPRAAAPWEQVTVPESVTKTGRAVVAHEAVTPFGVGAEMSSQIHGELFGQLAGCVIPAGASTALLSKALEAAWTPGPARIDAATRRTVGRLCEPSVDRDRGRCA